MEVSRNGAP